MTRDSKMPDEGSKRQQELVDTASELSFPASDPPSYMAGTAVAGAPPEEPVHREGVSTELIDPDAAKAPLDVEAARAGKDQPLPGGTE